MRFTPLAIALLRSPAFAFTAFFAFVPFFGARLLVMANAPFLALVLITLTIILQFANMFLAAFPHPIAWREAAHRNRHFAAYVPSQIQGQYVLKRSSVPGLWFVTLEQYGSMKRAPSSAIKSAVSSNA